MSTSPVYPRPLPPNALSLTHHCILAPNSSRHPQLNHRPCLPSNQENHPQISLTVTLDLIPQSPSYACNRIPATAFPHPCKYLLWTPKTIPSKPPAIHTLLSSKPLLQKAFPTNPSHYSRATIRLTALEIKFPLYHPQLSGRKTALISLSFLVSSPTDCSPWAYYLNMPGKHTTITLSKIQRGNRRHPAKTNPKIKT